MACTFEERVMDQLIDGRAWHSSALSKSTMQTRNPKCIRENLLPFIAADKSREMSSEIGKIMWLLSNDSYIYQSMGVVQNK